MTDITDKIEEVAQQPASANISPSSTAVTNQPIPDLIAADKYQRANAAAADATFGIRIGRFRANGASE